MKVPYLWPTLINKQILRQHTLASKTTLSLIPVNNHGSENKANRLLKVYQERVNMGKGSAPELSWTGTSCKINQVRILWPRCSLCHLSCSWETQALPVHSQHTYPRNIPTFKASLSSFIIPGITHSKKELELPIPLGGPSKENNPNWYKLLKKPTPASKND